MTLRPRYSLLTLLIVTALVLTALVAGGVKLWHGPHHVVELYSPTSEHEYTFTRNWKGHKKIQGTWVKRTLDKAGNVTSALLMYQRNDIRVLNTNIPSGDEPLIYVISIEGKQFQISEMRPTISKNPLTETEQQEFSNVIDRERQRVQGARKQENLIEGFWSPNWPEEK